MNIKSLKILNTKNVVFLVLRPKPQERIDPYNVEEKTIKFLLLLLFIGFINWQSYPVQVKGKVLECDLFHYIYTSSVSSGKLLNCSKPVSPQQE